MPPAHQHWTGTTWEPDPLILDDQALVVNVRGKGLVIVTGCGHAGAVNIVRYAQRLTGVPRLQALLGGLHLSGAFFTPSIGPTVHALTELAPDLLVPGHCTGWRAQHTLAAALPDSWVQGSSGTRYQLAASLPRLIWHLRCQGCVHEVPFGADRGIGPAVPRGPAVGFTSLAAEVRLLPVP